MCLTAEGRLGMQAHLAIDMRGSDAMLGLMPQQHSLAKQHQQNKYSAQPRQMIVPPCMHYCVRVFFVRASGGCYTLKTS